MKIQKINEKNDAIVGIVATFLIIGLIVTVLSVIQLVYIPKWMEQKEAEHMETVSDQFAQLKFAIDTQSALRRENTPISTSITLGNKELPFLMSSRSYGSLEIIQDEFTLTITDKNGKIQDPYILGIIKYQSDNTYYLDQEYIYEAGAVILSQNEGNTIFTKPIFSVDTGLNTIIDFTLIDITPVGGKKEIGGYGTYPIQIEYPEYIQSEDPDTITDVAEIKITTNYPNAWYKYFKNTIINNGFEENKDFSTLKDETEGKVIIKFADTKSVDINIFFVEIYAQIAPGWIENVKGTTT